MLRYFFEIGTDKSLFDGLYICGNKKLCEEYMGRFPVVTISLKGVNATDYENAKAQLIRVINREARRLQFLEDSERLRTSDLKQFDRLLDSSMDMATLTDSLRELTELLEKRYQKKAIVLIDEYDVPLAKANEHE